MFSELPCQYVSKYILCDVLQTLHSKHVHIDHHCSISMPTELIAPNALIMCIAIASHVSRELTIFPRKCKIFCFNQCNIIQSIWKRQQFFTPFVLLERNLHNRSSSRCCLIAGNPNRTRHCLVISVLVISLSIVRYEPMDIGVYRKIGIRCSGAVSNGTCPIMPIFVIHPIFEILCHFDCYSEDHFTTKTQQSRPSILDS